MVLVACSLANGPYRGCSPRHVLRFVSFGGLRVGHTPHRDRQETRWRRKGSSGDPQWTGPRCGERPAYPVTTHVHSLETHVKSNILNFQFELLKGVNC